MMEKADNTSPSESNLNVDIVKEGRMSHLLNTSELKMEFEYDNCESDKVYIQETFISENHIKQEPCDTNDIIENNTTSLSEIINCESNIKLEEESLINNTEACIVDDKVIVQETVFLNDVKKESYETDRRDLCCRKCNQVYELYCTKCPMLIRILDNCTTNDIQSKAKKTLPKNILEIRNVLSNVKVYAVKVIPEGTIFGPFEGLHSVPSTTGSTWRLKGGKLVYPENSECLNWMEYVNYVPHSSDQNLLVFQYQDRLYYRSTRIIEEGEELLVYYCEEPTNNSEDDESEMYLHPIVAKDFKNVYACTYCCLGYSLEEDLLIHKMKCSGINTEAPPVEGVVQCSLCMMYMEKREHSEHHMKYCWEKNSRPDVLHISTESLLYNCTLSTSDGHVHLHDPSVKPKRYECKKCIFKTSKEVAFKYHMLNKHEEHMELIACQLCAKQFTKRSSLKKHLTFSHNAERTIGRTYKCPYCPYENKFRGALRQHLKLHNKVDTVYQCDHCPYRTENKHRYEAHVYTHDKAKHLVCQVCGREFAIKKDFLIHIKFEHENSGCRVHKCHACDYQTDRKYALKVHLNVHDDSKNYKCTICDFQTIYKQSLDQHLLNHTDVRRFLCPKCPYRSNRSYNYREHLLTHEDVKPFNCETCGKQFTKKRSFALHIKNKHGSSVDVGHPSSIRSK